MSEFKEWRATEEQIGNRALTPSEIRLARSAYEAARRPPAEPDAGARAEAPDVAENVWGCRKCRKVLHSKDRPGQHWPPHEQSRPCGHYMEPLAFASSLEPNPGLAALAEARAEGAEACANELRRIAAQRAPGMPQDRTFMDADICDQYAARFREGREAGGG